MTDLIAIGCGILGFLYLFIGAHVVRSGEKLYLPDVERYKAASLMVTWPIYIVVGAILGFVLWFARLTGVK